MHQWTVGGALIEGEGGLLLVRNRRRGGREDWTPPGGVIDDGEDLVAGLTREVTEETGLVVANWEGPAWRIEVAAVDLGWQLYVEVWRATDYAGDLAAGADPDGIVVEACFATPQQCTTRLGGTQPWVRDPLVAWLAGPWDGTRDYGYRLSGASPDTFVVERQ